MLPKPACTRQVGFAAFFRAFSWLQIYTDLKRDPRRKRLCANLAAAGLGDVTIQARKTYVLLVTARRTSARVQPTTKLRLDLALRLEGQQPAGRLQPSKIHETTPLQVSLTSLDEVDAEVLDWLQKAYEQN